MTKIALFISFYLACTPFHGANASGPHKSALAQVKRAETPLSPEDLKFGEEQLQKMLSDRRQLKKILFKNEPIWPWVVRQFAKDAGGERIYWESAELSEKGYEYDSDNLNPTPGRCGYIRVRKTDETGKPMAASRSLAAFVFECFNMRNGPAFDKLEEMALKGKYSKDEYIDAGTRIEFAATRKTAEFYKTVYLPLAKKRNYDTDPLYWEATTPTTYRAWRARYTDHKKYPWSFWGSDYDRRIAPYLRPRPLN